MHSIRYGARQTTPQGCLFKAQQVANYSRYGARHTSPQGCLFSAQQEGLVPIKQLLKAA